MNLNVHQTYVCFSETGCSITLRDGTPCKEVPAYEPTLFVAQQHDMACSDPKAVVRELPNGLELLHGQMMAEQPETGINLMKYAECVTVDDILAVNPDYKNDVTSDGAWIYPLTELQNAKQMFVGARLVRFEGELPKLTNAQEMFQSENLTSFNVKLPKLENGGAMFINNPLTSWNVALPNLTNARHMFQRTKLTSWNIELPKLTEGYSMFYRVSTLTSFNVDLPKLSSGDIMFLACVLDKESALRILNSIPTYTSSSHLLTIGIHIDHQTDDEVLEAITNAESKRWALTVQWNGTPTAQAATTYGLRKPPIYARVSEMELPDGTTERFLDWGHYVTDPSGYEEFRSVEEAREYFGLPDGRFNFN